MLTRLEVDGFKNLLDFKCDFGPYTCIAGKNAIGKSNIFDAVEFLSLLADHTFMDAAKNLRSTESIGIDPSELFWHGNSETPRKMKLAAEMIVPSQILDDFNRRTTPTTTYLRYELELRYSTPDERGPGLAGTIELVSEQLTHINKSDATSRMPWTKSKRKFRDNVIRGRRSGSAYISTTSESGELCVNVHQDGKSRGKPRKSPAKNAPRTIVCTTTTEADQTILAARREMQSWRKLALEPTAMRSPDSITGSDTVSPNGAHIAAALYRIANRGEDRNAYRQVAFDASALVDLHEVDVDYDLARELLTLKARVGDDPTLTARSLSDGTLRFLTLCIILNDDSFTGLLCMEEPENGIHPARIGEMYSLLRRLAVNPDEEIGERNPLRQVIVNTHSPAFVNCHINDADILFAQRARIKRGETSAETIRLSPLSGDWREHSGIKLERRDINEYLTQVPNQQLTIDDENQLY